MSKLSDQRRDRKVNTKNLRPVKNLVRSALSEYVNDNDKMNYQKCDKATLNRMRFKLVEVKWKCSSVRIFKNRRMILLFEVEVEKKAHKGIKHVGYFEF